MDIKVALDAMGGDFRAIPNLQGAYLAASRGVGEGIRLKVFLCGRKDEILQAIPKAAQDESTKPEYRVDVEAFEGFLADGRFEIVDCPEVVGMDESPSVAVRAKKASSMAKCFHLVRDGMADAAISAGNSGAMMAYGVSILKRLPSIKRPAIMCHFPSREGVTALLDAGANVDCTVQHLEQFAQMGKIYMQTVFSKEKVRVALLNIGEEEGKGNEIVKETHAILKQSLGEHYVGFVEGRDILMGKVDVIVCDGFVGNVALKTAEGVAKVIQSILKEEFSRSPIWGLGAWLAKGGFMAMKTKLDYREYGAAPLIGLQGLGLVAHGSSDAKAINSALRIAAHYTKQGLMTKLNAAFGSIENEMARQES